MNRWSRRQFGKRVGASLFVGLAPAIVRGQTRPKVVVIGGGVGGATVARAMPPNIDVTLIERRPKYVTPFFLNHYLAGLRPLESLTHGYDGLARITNLVVVHGEVTVIDPDARQVRLRDGAAIRYDRLVLAPGIAFRFGAIPGLDAATSDAMPHAWDAGPQSAHLRRQLQGMADGGVFIIAVPPAPFRCPIGPYERASLVAHYFRQAKPKSKVLIIDSADSFAYQELFEDGWARHHAGMIEWLPRQFTDGVQAVDIATNSVITGAASFKAAVASVIPEQGAGPLAVQAGLTDASGWCPVDPVSFQSALRPDIHIIGDAILGGDMPKSASAAHAQAKSCAIAIAAALTGADPVPPPLTNGCYGFLDSDDAFVNALTFSANVEQHRIVLADSAVNKIGEPDALRRQVARAAEVWYGSFTRALFG